MPSVSPESERSNPLDTHTTIILQGNSFARVTVDGTDRLVEIELAGLMGTVRILMSVDAGGLELLRHAVDRTAACVATSARSGPTVISGQALNYPTDLGVRLRERREELNVMPGDLARRMRVSHSDVSRVERGLKQPSMLLVAKFAKALDIPLDVLLSHEPHGRQG